MSIIELGASCACTFLAFIVGYVLGRKDGGE